MYEFSEVVKREGKGFLGGFPDLGIQGQRPSRMLKKPVLSQVEGSASGVLGASSPSGSQKQHKCESWLRRPRAHEGRNSEEGFIVNNDGQAEERRRDEYGKNH